jgi:hypothetical protein
MLKDYTRVNFFLPLTPRSVSKIREIIKELYVSFRGLTHSRTSKPSPFIGYYFDKNNKLWIDHIVSFYLDIDSEDTTNWEQYFMTFKQKYEKELGECKIWIMTYPVCRIIPEEGEPKKCQASG